MLENHLICGSTHCINTNPQPSDCRVYTSAGYFHSNTGDLTTLVCLMVTLEYYNQTSFQSRPFSHFVN